MLRMYTGYWVQGTQFHLRSGSVKQRQLQTKKNKPPQKLIQTSIQIHLYLSWNLNIHMLDIVIRCDSLCFLLAVSKTKRQLINNKHYFFLLALNVLRGISFSDACQTVFDRTRTTKPDDCNQNETLLSTCSWCARATSARNNGHLNFNR